MGLWGAVGGERGPLRGHTGVNDALWRTRQRPGGVGARVNGGEARIRVRPAKELTIRSVPDVKERRPRRGRLTLSSSGRAALPIVKGQGQPARR